jgi:histidinol-phosphate/aromatic aminotransferase/cobyric acid decarboxylase-like protein/GNAT superfamily N-acetyltransferase
MLKGFVRMKSMSPRLLLSRRSATQNQDRVSRVSIALASHQEREAIYRLRHTVYASELRQHTEHHNGMLSDALDAVNMYIVARVSERVVGFVSITPPTAQKFSIEKYLSRDELPFPLDEGVYEIRLLTVDPAYRRRRIASLLMYAALRWVESHGGTRIIAMGRREVLDFYRKVGLQTLGHTIRSGAVTFELMGATPEELRARAARYSGELHELQQNIEWQLDVPFHEAPPCFHGGAFWEAIGASFGTLERKDQVINADVLDAWFPPAPQVLQVLQEHLSWLIRTSPPTNSEGLVRTIAEVRGISPECIVPGAGSSSLIFLAFRLWLRPSSKVLILDPTYGEYPHVFQHVVRCHVERLPLLRQEAYRLDLGRLMAQVADTYDLIVLVNPNSPTGQHVPRQALESVLKEIPEHTRVWVDETYVDYVGPDASLEPFAMRSKNVIVCKSMSKVYALSGVRAAYLCAPPPLAAELRGLTPPWAVSLPAQMAAVAALREPAYYAARYQDTHVLRTQLVEGLSRLRGIEIVPSAANWVLCHLPPSGKDAPTVCQECQRQGVFLRDLSSLSPRLGTHAVRIAVKDTHANQRMVDILARVLGEPQHRRP